MAEFKVLVASVGEIEGLLEQASAAPPMADPYAPLKPLDEARRALDEAGDRVVVFEKRAKEKDPDKQVYGPKMAQRVLEMVSRFVAAVEHAGELDEVLAPLRKQQTDALDVERRKREEAAEAEAVIAKEAAAAVAAARELVEREAAAGQEAGEREERERVAQRLRLIAEGAAGVDPRRGLAPAPQTGLSLLEAEVMLRANCTDLEHRTALQALHLLASNAVAHPEEPHFRSVRLLNETFQRSIARHPGGVEVLLGLGFVEREALEGDSSYLHYVLEEPPIEDVDAWARWFDRTKAMRDELANIMTAERIRILPTATKGTSWEQLANDAKQPPPGRHDVEVLHGQVGGGS